MIKVLYKYRFKISLNFTQFNKRISRESPQIPVKSVLPLKYDPRTATTKDDEAAGRVWLGGGWLAKCVGAKTTCYISSLVGGTP